VSSGAAVQEEFFFDYLTTILRNLCNYLPVNTEYYSRRMKSLTSKLLVALTRQIEDEPKTKAYVQV
jgi:hypothetical protein